MTANHGGIVLASASPRRSELMALAGIEFSVVSADIDETPLPGESAEDHVLRLSKGKADAVAAGVAGRFIIGADTVVVLDGTIMGKPRDEAEAWEMLSALSGRVHDVITGFTVFDRISGIHVSRSVCTEVTFRQLSPDEIRAYIATGCPMDKAGAYALQGIAGLFVSEIQGSPSNVIGLPLQTLRELLDLAGCQILG